MTFVWLKLLLMTTRMVINVSRVSLGVSQFISAGMNQSTFTDLMGRDWVTRTVILAWLSWRLLLAQAALRVSVVTTNAAYAMSKYTERQVAKLEVEDVRRRR